MIDIHCHLLPAVDDGAKSWEVTLAMCRMAQQDGVTHIVATPHCNYEFSYDRAAHQALLDEVRERVPEMTFSLGCDFHLSFENVKSAVMHPERYAIGESSYLLVELSEFTTFNVKQILYELQTAGLTPIITHPERNPSVLAKPDLVAEWCDIGCLVQITANSLTGYWGRHSQKLSESLLKKRLAHFIASDAHGLHNRPPVISGARTVAVRILGEARANRLVAANPEAVIANQLLMA